MSKITEDDMLMETEDDHDDPDSESDSNKQSFFLLYKLKKEHKSIVAEKEDLKEDQQQQSHIGEIKPTNEIPVDLSESKVLNEQTTNNTLVTPTVEEVLTAIEEAVNRFLKA